MSENCRFCLKNLGYNDKFHEIDDEIKSDFSDLTNHELMISDGHMNIVCELCLRSLQLASTLKKQLIENQENFFKEYGHDPIGEFEESANCKEKSDLFEIHSVFTDINSGEIKQENVLDEVVIQSSQEPQIPTNIFSSKHQPDKNKSERNIVCGACGKSFKRIESLRLHMVHHENPKYGCDMCTKNFLDKSALNQHMRVIHLNKKLYRCTHCPKAYSKNCSLKRHIILMHKKQKFICGVPTCLMSFNYKHDCKAHIKTKHQDIGPEQMENYIILSGTRTFQSNVFV